MSTSYISTHGMIWGEISAAGVTKSYGHDALGSVTETFTSSSVQNTYRYKPYGSTLAKTGTAADPAFIWNGGSGYRATTLQNCGFYVRHRHYSSSSARWTCVDMLWPSQPAFSYSTSPQSQVDYSGLNICNCTAFNPPPVTVDTSWNYVLALGFATYVYIGWTNQTTYYLNRNSDCSGKVSTLHHDALVIDGLTDSALGALCTVLTAAKIAALPVAPEVALILSTVSYFLCMVPGGNTISKIPCVIEQSQLWGYVHSYQFSQSFTSSTTLTIGKCGRVGTCAQTYQATCGTKTTCDFHGACVPYSMVC